MRLQSILPAVILNRYVCSNTCEVRGSFDGSDSVCSRVLVTGGAGFIGSNLVESLLSQNLRVRVLDSLETGFIQYLDITHPNLEVLVGSIEDMNLLRTSVDGMDGVFHLAAASKVAPSLKDPSMATLNVRANALGTANILEASVQSGSVKRFVYAASSTYYGNQAVPFTESAPFVPSSPYAASKFMGELITSTYDTVFNLSTVNLRFFMVYGPRQPTTGGYAIVTGKFMNQASRNETLTIEGTGENFRDFIHVQDLVAGIVAAFKSEVRGTTINLGSGEKHTIKEVADMISHNQTHVAPRPFDLQGTLANTSLAESALGFKPIHDFKTETLRMKRNPDEQYLNAFWKDPGTLQKLNIMIPGYSNMTLVDQNEAVVAQIKEKGFHSFREMLI